jgi:hypothetical protein
MRRNLVTRRHFLTSSGIALALPFLESLAPAQGHKVPLRRIVVVLYPVGLHPANFFPQQPGRNYTASRYLKHIEDYRGDFTVFSGLSHARIGRAHAGDQSFLTGAPYERPEAFRNTISLDQFAAAYLGTATRFPSLTLGDGLSFNQSGVKLPGFNRPSDVFTRLFLSGSPAQIVAQRRRLQEGRSILDLVGHESNQMQRNLPVRDQARLDEYFDSVRQLERRLVQADEWESIPRPRVTAPTPKDVNPNADPIGHLRLMYDLIQLALQTDTTRIITLHGGLLNSQPVIDGSSLDYHNLSHHSMNADKITSLGLIEDELMRAFRDLLKKLQETREKGETLLDRTMVLLGSNLGNASSHETTNLPILLAGGGFRHGQHLVFNRENNTPLCNLYVTMLQRLGMEVSSFGTSRGTVTGLEA